MAVGSTVAAAAGFKPARRKQEALTAAVERRALQWMAARAPAWVTSDGLTLLGFAAQIGVGACYALARYNRWALVAGILCLALNWLGDSLDGTLARARRLERPRYGFYADHVVDIFGAAAMMGGLAWSGLLHPLTAAAMLVTFLLLAGESYLAAYTLARFELSQGLFGPTELRILLAMGNLALLHSAYATIFGHRLLLFDLGGWMGAAGMLVLAVRVSVRHTAELYRQEPLP